MPPLDPIATLFLLLIAVALPLICIRNHYHLSRTAPLPSFRAAHLNSLIVLGSLTAFALWVARRVGMSLFPSPRFDLTLTLYAVAGVVTLLLVSTARWRLRPPTSRARMVAILPRTPRDYLMWLAVCTAAGIGEEIIYRGVLHGTLQYITSSWLAAALIGAVVFGLSHAIQGWWSVAVISLLAFLVQCLVLHAGDLYLAMAAHFTYDLAIGFAYSRMAQQAGLFTEPEPPAPPAAAP